MIDLALATLLGAGLSMTGGIVGNLINSNIADRNIAYQREANSANIAFQKEENEITRQREDNAVQRRALDLQNAGLSKTLSAGSPASAQPLSAPQQQALNNQFKYESTLQKMNLASILQDMVVKKEQVAQNWAKIDIAEKETDANIAHLGVMDNYYDSLTEINKVVGENKGRQVNAEISYYTQMVAESKSRQSLNQQTILKMSYEISKIIAETNNLSTQQQMMLVQIIGQRLTNLTSSWNLSKYINYGTPTNYTPSEFGKVFRDGAGVLDHAIFGDDFYTEGLDAIMSSY